MVSKSYVDIQPGRLTKSRRKRDQAQLYSKHQTRGYHIGCPGRRWASNFEVKRFTDQRQLTDNKNVKIVKLIVYFDGESLAGLKAFYRRETHEKDIIVGQQQVIKVPGRVLGKQVIKFNPETEDYLQYIHGCLDTETKFFKYLRFISAQGHVYEVGSSLGPRDRVIKIKNLYDEIPICLSVTCYKLVGNLRSRQPDAQPQTFLGGRLARIDAQCLKQLNSGKLDKSIRLFSASKTKA